MNDDVLLIGIDGGATEVKAHAVAPGNLSWPTEFELRPEAASQVYPRAPGFVPLPVAEQLAQRDADHLQFTPDEQEQGRMWVTSAAEAVIGVVRQCAASRVLVGMGMPGLKTPDQRGICVINNGPRIPAYLELLEHKLAAAGIELVKPVAALGSDADYCGLGEEHAANGLFRDVANAYYVGCGTGVADALKLCGALVPFDAAKAWICKSWQMPSALGPTFEKLVSAKSLNDIYARLSTREASDVAAGTSPADQRSAAQRYPEQAAATGNAIAATWLNTAALVLAELIFERLWTVRNGRADATHRGDACTQLSTDHEYRGLILERIVIGQRLGQIYADPRYGELFGQTLERGLATLIANSGDRELGDACLSPNAQLKSGFVQASKLRAAPALGAAVAALRAFCGD